MKAIWNMENTIIRNHVDYTANPKVEELSRNEQEQGFMCDLGRTAGASGRETQ